MESNGQEAQPQYMKFTNTHPGLYLFIYEQGKSGGAGKKVGAGGERRKNKEMAI